MAIPVEQRDRLYVIGFLVAAGILLYLGRDLVQGSALITWGLTFSGTTAVAALVASLYRVRLQLRASRHELARKEAELNFALEVQRALFPRQLPAGNGLEFSAVCIPAKGISGDYYDVIQLPDGRLVFAIADVSGKGISAAILMANMQALLRTLAATHSSPDEVCARLNRHLHQVTDDSRFATLFYGDWDPNSRSLRYVNAGHHPPILVGSSDARLDRGGMPLGLFSDTEFQMGEALLQPNDMLVLYSDGVTEAESQTGEQFGETRLRQLIERGRGLTPPEIEKRVLYAVQQWSGGELDDDLTLLIVKADAGADNIRDQVNLERDTVSAIAR